MVLNAASQQYDGQVAVSTTGWVTTWQARVRYDGEGDWRGTGTRPIRPTHPTGPTGIRHPTRLGPTDRRPEMVSGSGGACSG